MKHDTLLIALGEEIIKSTDGVHLLPQAAFNRFRDEGLPAYLAATMTTHFVYAAIGKLNAAILTVDHLEHTYQTEDTHGT